MTIDHFWAIVEEVHRDSGGGMDAKCELLSKRLRFLPIDEIRSFGEHFAELFRRAYTWELWAAAYIIGGGCSDDSFTDFRGTLISMGRQIFEGALVDPESLADIDYDAKIARYEGYQYVVGKVYREMGGPPILRSGAHPSRPSGQEWEEATVAQVYPKLAAKYGFR